MFTINLHKLNFHAYHGIYDDERILGNNYEVNVVISFEVKEQVTSLDQTINYEVVYNIIKQRMLIPSALLETLAQDIAAEIYNYEKRIKTISVSIEKKNPPIENMEGSVIVHYKTDF